MGTVGLTCHGLLLPVHLRQLLQKARPGAVLPLAGDGQRLSAWLVTAFSLVDVLLVAYHLFPYAAVQAVGFALIVGTLPLFLLTAFVRNRRSGQPS